MSLLTTTYKILSSQDQLLVQLPSCFPFFKRIGLIKVEHFSKICYNTSDPSVNAVIVVQWVIPSLQICTATLLIL